MVQPPIRVAPNSEEPFSRGYCAFDFATTSQQLSLQFCSEPLNVEVWQSHDQPVGVAKVRHIRYSPELYDVPSPLNLPPPPPPPPPHTHTHTHIYTHKVPLSEVMSCEKRLVGSVVRQVSSLRVPITPPHTPHPVTGYLQLVLVLEDRGTVRLKSGDSGEGVRVDGGRGGSTQGETSVLTCCFQYTCTGTS